MCDYHKISWQRYECRGSVTAHTVEDIELNIILRSDWT